MCSRFLKGFEISIDLLALNGYKEKGRMQSAFVTKWEEPWTLVSGLSSKSFPLHKTQFPLL